MSESSDNHPIVADNHPIRGPRVWPMESSDNHPTDANFHPIIEGSDSESSGNRQPLRTAIDHSESIDNSSMTLLDPSTGVANTQRNRPVIDRKISRNDRQTNLNHPLIINPFLTIINRFALIARGGTGAIRNHVLLLRFQGFRSEARASFNGPPMATANHPIKRPPQSLSNRKTVPANRKPIGTRTGRKP